MSALMTSISSDTLVYMEQRQSDGTWFRMSSSLRPLDDALSYLIDTYTEDRTPYSAWGVYRFISTDGSILVVDDLPSYLR